MNWRFSIIDFTVNPAGVTTVLPDEPIGWDDSKIVVKRGITKSGNDNTHGLLFEYSFNTLGFINDGYSIIKTAYDGFGIEAKVDILVEFACGDNAAYQEFYYGTFDFKSIDFERGDNCIVEIAIQQKGCLTTFQNRFDQKVDLESLTSFDGEALPAYDSLGFQIQLESKEIYLESRFSGGQNISKAYVQFAQTSQGRYHTIGWDLDVVSDLQNIDIFAYDVPDPYNPGGFTSITVADLIDSNDGILNLVSIAEIKCPSQDLTFEIVLEGTLNEISNDQDREFGWTFWLYHVNEDGTVVKASVILQSSAGLEPYSVGVLNSANININYTNTFTVETGDRFYLALGTDLIFTTGGLSILYDDQLDVEFTDTSFKVYTTSICEPTTCKAFKINEVFSRVAEAYTNDCLRVFSDYYGREDAQPYVSASLGCGAERVLTNGLMIRQALRADGTEPRFWTSFKDMFDSMNAIDNIGMGIEDDPNRPGEQLIRIEPVAYWYSNTLIHTCDQVKDIRISVDEKRIYSTVDIGYQKWEAEQYNGLDEFLTKRTYRTELTQIQNSLQKLCAFIASGYAMEVTRREGNSSKDYRYDNDNFIICTRESKEYSLTFQDAASTFPDSILFIGVTVTYQVGDTLTITGTVSNNTTYTITSGPFYNGSDTLYGVSPSPVDEVAVTATVAGTFVDIGVSSPANLLGPSTIYNARISPARNLFRWFKSVAASWSKQYTAAVKYLLFTNGEGNYIAGMVLDYGNACDLYQLNLVENLSIAKNIFADANEATPIWEPEIIEFEYPLAVDDFNTIRANPKGLIRATQGANTYDGWIEEIEYDPNEGMAQFKLIKKFS